MRSTWWLPLLLVLTPGAIVTGFADEPPVDDVFGIPLLSARPIAADEPSTADADTEETVRSQYSADEHFHLSDVFPFFSGDSSLQEVGPLPDEKRPFGLQILVIYDGFRGVPDDSWENNGIRVGGNLGTKLGSFSDATGIGFQGGASLGVYDWAGTDYRFRNKDQAETQGFFTYGLFRRADEISPISAAVVQDIMVNANYGVFAQTPVLSQIRSQIGYATSASNEFGVWGTARVVESTHLVGKFGPITWRPINQVSAYWHHKWSLGGPDTWLSVGIPEYERIAGGGSVGDYLVTATSLCPLNDAVSIYSSVMYMHQSAAPGAKGADDEAWNFSVGLTFYPRRMARSSTVAGQRWMPLLPLADNGSFIVDTNRTY